MLHRIVVSSHEGMSIEILLKYCMQQEMLSRHPIFERLRPAFGCLLGNLPPWKIIYKLPLCLTRIASTAELTAYQGVEVSKTSNETKRCSILVHIFFE